MSSKTSVASALAAPPWAQRWNFVDYAEYLDYQRSRSRRSPHLTKRYGEHRARLAELVTTHCPAATSALCLGARHSLEIEDFRRFGFAAEGIDLFADGLVRRCDMSRLEDDPFCERDFDVFFGIFAFEHCYDFERFREKSLRRCRRMIAGVVPTHTKPKTSRWNCTAFDFQHPLASAAAFEMSFPGFELVHREVVGKSVRFVLRRTERSDCELKAGDAAASTAISLKNVMVANHIQKSRCSKETLDRLLHAQIENSLEVGWHPTDILLVTNFPFAFRGVVAEEVELDTHCPRGSKMFAIERLLRRYSAPDCVLWAHDLDCWQNDWFEVPSFADVGACEYSRPKFNGGSVFWRPAAIDIAAEVVRRLRSEQANREEPTLNTVFRENAFRRRVTVLNPTYNVGCSGYKERLSRSEKPVRACHFHPTNRLAWGTHILNRHGFEDRSASSRLERLLRRWYPGLPTVFV